MLGSLGHLFGQLTCSLWTCSTLIPDELLSFFYGTLLSLSDFMVCWSHDGLFWMYGHLISQGQMFHLLWDPVAWQKQFFDWFSALIAWPCSRILCVCVAVLSGLSRDSTWLLFLPQISLVPWVLWDCIAAWIHCRSFFLLWALLTLSSPFFLCQKGSEQYSQVQKMLPSKLKGF